MERLPNTLGNVVEIQVVSGARCGEQLWFFDAERIRLGRNPANEVVLPDSGVSRFHAELRASGDGDGYELGDSGSTAGTFLDQAGVAERVPLESSKLLSPGVYDVLLGQGGPHCRIGVGISVPFGRYRLIARLGGGGMAEVYLARQTGLGGFNRPVALKLIQPELFDVVDASAMFLDEARIAAEINHHNVVKIYDVGEHDGVLFLTMEHLRGITLSHLRNKLRHVGKKMPPDLVAALLSQACAGLHATHSLRDLGGRLLHVVHRDVSPSNLMCTSEGLLKVIDFGVARADTRLVQKDEGLQGKPAYMSPEQIQGRSLDARSDVFALGVVLYELCCDRPLFQRDDLMATFYAVVREDVPPLRSFCPQASAQLEAAVHKALAKDPAQRFQSAAELALELDKTVQEAGGRFANISAIARFLQELDIHLNAIVPVLLSRVPKPLLSRREPARRNSSVSKPLARPAEVAPPISTAQGPDSTLGFVPVAPTALLSVTVPLPGPEHTERLRGPAGHHLSICTLSFRAPRQLTAMPLPLLLGADQPWLPAPIALTALGTTLMVELEEHPGGRDRPSLYHNAFLPNTRCESFTLQPSTKAGHFDVGHRRTTVQRIDYASTIADSAGNGRLRLVLADLRVELVGSVSLLRLCALHTSDAAHKMTCLICVLIEP